MKHLFLPLLLLVSLISSAQTHLPVIKASSTNALIVADANERLNWTLSPEIKPDVYTISKNPKTARIAFHTDVDSISFRLKPGKSVDFVVLLNGKDSCFTRIQSPEIKNFSKLKPAIHDTIPFILSDYNNLIVKALLNNQDTLFLKFDTGTTDFLLTRDAIKTKTHITDVSSKTHTFKIGNSVWEKQEIYPVELSGQGTDGRFGWNLFDGQIVEIDYDRSLFIIHSTLPKKGKGYARFPMEYIQSLFCIQAELEVKNKRYEGRFLFDNGYQRTIMLDQDLMREQQYPKDELEVLKKVIMKNGQGKDVPVLTVNNEKAHFGRFILENIPVQLMTTSNPARFKTHILGNEVLKRFNTILDFQQNVVYLKANRLVDAPYAEGKKN